ncbi:MAG: hypothetical protein ABI780_03345 [Ardenticatenales bacterium]
MLHTRYDFGDESPATDLTHRQLRAALADRGGALWVDARAPTDADAAVLANSLRLPPPVVAWLCHAAPRPELPPADALTCLTLADGSGEIDIALGPNLVVMHDRGSHAYGAHLTPPAVHTIPLGIGADGLVAHVVARIASDLDAAVATLGGSVAQAITDAARRPGEAGTALHAVQRRTTGLAETIAADQAAAQTLRAAAQVHDGARAVIDTALGVLAEAAADAQAVAEQARTATPGPEVLALAAIARDVAVIKWLLIVGMAIIALLALRLAVGY